MYIAPGQGQTTPPVSKYFHKHKPSVNLIISCKFFPLNDFVTVFPIQPHTILGDQILTCLKLGHGQPKVIIYKYFVECESLVLQAKFQDHMTFGFGE